MFKYPSPPRWALEDENVSYIRGFAFEQSPPETSQKEEHQSLQELGKAAAASKPFDSVPEHLKTQMWKDFDTEEASVFTLSADGKTYLEPAAMRGVPVDRINVSHPYWQRSWITLESVLANEKEAHEKKNHYRAQADACGIGRKDRKNELRKMEKEASDDCSKYAKIREIFADGKYHPNQVVAKCFIPPEGLCEKELLYKFALKISNLKDLYDKKKIKMDPFNFYRWAITKQLQSTLHQAVTKTHSSLKAIIRGMGDEKKRYSIPADEVFRAVVLYWAKLTGNENKFRVAGKKRAPKSQSHPRSLEVRSFTEKGSRDWARRVSRLEKREKLKAAATAAPSVYPGGVNAYRASVATGKIERMEVE